MTGSYPPSKRQRGLRWERKLGGAGFEGLSEGELLDSVRGGNEGAFGELWRRNAGASLRSASFLASDLDPEDVLAEAYLRVFLILKAGKGPTSGFRAYVQTTIKNVAMSVRRSSRDHLNLDELFDGRPELTQPGFEEQSADGALVRQALAQLPADWQEVLWCTEVLGMKPREIASRLNLTANAVAALSYRARSGLKQKWMEIYVAFETRPAGCQTAIRGLASLLEGDSTPEDSLSVETHLAGCESCRDVYEELQLVGSRSLRIAAVGVMLLIGGGLGWPGQGGSLEDAATAAVAEEGADRGFFATHRVPVLAVALAVLVASVVVVVSVSRSEVPDSPSPSAAPSGVQPSKMNGSEGNQERMPLEGASFRVGADEVTVEGAFVRSVVVDLRGVEGIDLAMVVDELAVVVTPGLGAQVSAFVENPEVAGLYTAGVLTEAPGMVRVEVCWGELLVKSDAGESWIDLAFGGTGRD